jgi:hypothetical protein
MQGYSIGGYLRAVLLRTPRTILVEGVTDQTLLVRLKRVRSAEAGTELHGQVDVAGLLSDPRLEGLGMRETIRVVRQEVASSGPVKAAMIDRKFGTLIDREWDGVQVDMQLQLPWSAPVQGGSHFTTVGHSVENYFFRLEAISAYLRQIFSDHLDQNFFNDLDARFHTILGFAAIYSLAIRHIQAISRSGTVITRDHLVWENGRYLVTNDLEIALNARGLQLPVEFSGFINFNIDTYLAQHHGQEPARWLCHGHLGEDAIWACIANLARVHNVNNEISNVIERGFKDVRFKLAVDYLARESIELSGPLGSAVEWLTAA